MSSTASAAIVPAAASHRRNVRQSLGMNRLAEHRQIVLKLRYQPRQPDNFRQLGHWIGQHRLDPHRVIGQMRFARAAQSRMDQEHIAVRRDQRLLGEAGDLAQHAGTTSFPLLAQWRLAQRKLVAQIGQRGPRGVLEIGQAGLQTGDDVLDPRPATDRLDDRRFDKLPPARQIAGQWNQIGPEAAGGEWRGGNFRGKRCAGSSRTAASR